MTAAKQVEPVLARHELLNRCAAINQSKRYLEIGVAKGNTLQSITVAERTAVDPRFKFETSDPAFTPPGCRTFFHKLTSDQFFGQLDPSISYDLIFLDGLHTYEQTLRDLINSLSHSHRRSFIVIDDTVPSSYLASLPVLRQATRCRKALGEISREWMGDVYKVILFVADYIPHLNYATYAGNHGQTVLWRKNKQANSSRALSLTSPHLDLESISRFDYKDLVINKEKLLNIQPFSEIEKAIIQDFSHLPG